MDPLTVTIIAAGTLGFALVSGRLDGTVITPPLVFVAFGYALGDGGLSLSTMTSDHSAIHIIAELTLILVLFADAARIDFGRLRRDHNLPTRMLAIGMPLTIVLGTLAALALFPAFGFWEAALVAALLAPTDAALGQAVVTARVVPVRIRQAINVESGLNDGIALPAVLVCAAAAGMEDVTSTAQWLNFILLQITLGPLVGVIIGYAGARLLDSAAARGWSGTSFSGIGILTIALLSFAAAELVGGNGFIGAFVAGMMFGNAVKNECLFLFEFMETQGQLLMLLTFLLFGAVLLPIALHGVSWSVLAYAVLSLTVLRLVPIGLALAGSGLGTSSKLFLGWFGPRGLASILFVLLILEESSLPHREEILVITLTTVALSVLLHGLSASPLANAYGAAVGRMGRGAEHQPTAVLPLRDGTMLGDADHTGATRAP